MIYFPVPGFDIVYRDWSLGVNVMDYLGPTIARTSAQGFLHGAWPFSLRVSKQFGDFDK